MIDAILIGAGLRGKTYTDLGSQLGIMNVVAVAEPIDDRRNYIKKKYSLPDDRCFKSWEKLLKMPKIADAAIIATQDKQHFEPAMQAMKMNYHLLLEKPVAPTAEECLAIEREAHKRNLQVLVCHVLRYAPFFKKVRDVIDEGLVGDIINIDHIEGVGNLHQSHSYVRGNWHNSAESSDMLLAKSCHDIDIIQWLLGKNCSKVQSFGSLSYFTAKNRPEGAPERCIDGCPYSDSCFYNAVKIYYDDKKNRWFRTAATKKTEPDDNDVLEALRTTDYGKCVFSCGNDVVDHQSVNMEFDGGVTVTFTMSAFNKGGRRINIMGTKGELSGDMKSSSLTLFDFATRTYKDISILGNVTDESIVGGHGGGDKGIVIDFCDLIEKGEASRSVCDIGVSCRNHLVVFAAEKSRRTDTVVDVNEYIESVGENLDR